MAAQALLVPEIVDIVLSHLSAEDVVRAAGVCYLWKSRAYDEVCVLCGVFA